MYMNEYPQGEVIVLAQNYSCAAEINDLYVRVTHYYDLANPVRITGTSRENNQIYINK